MTQVDEVLDMIPMGFFHYRLLVLTGLAFMADAMEVSLLAFLSQCAGADWNLSSGEMASITSSVFMGELVGGIFFGPLADKYGRKVTYLAACSLISIAGVASGGSPNLGTLITLRAIVGFGVGGLTVPFDLLAEFLPAEHRGQVLLCIEYFWTLGSLFVAGMAWIIVDDGGWRMLTYITAIPVIVASLISIVWLPESPRWLVEQGRLQEATDELNLAAEVNGTPLPPYVLVTAEKMQKRHESNASAMVGRTRVSMNDNASSSDSKRDPESPPVTSPSGAAPTAAGAPEGTAASRAAEDADNFFKVYLELLNDVYRGISLPLWLVWFSFGVSYYGIILFVTRLYTTNDDDGDDDSAGSCSFDYADIFLNASMEIVGLFIATTIVDRYGRVFTQGSGYAGAAVGVLIMGWGLSKGGMIAFAMLARGAIMCASCGTWVHTPELYGDDCRATAHSASNVVARLGALLSPFIVQSDLSIGVVGFVLSIFNVMALMGTLMLPETNGMDLEGFDKAPGLFKNPVMDKLLSICGGRGGNEGAYLLRNDRSDAHVTTSSSLPSS